MNEIPGALVAYARSTWNPLGIVVSGSIVRGESGPHSDWDVFIVHDQPWRIREQRRFDGVPAELFVNPPAQIRRYFATEHAHARPCTAHMLSTGVVVEPADPIVHALVAEARDWLSRPPPPADLQMLAYGAVDLLDDARDVHGLDPAAELLLLAQSVDKIAEHAFRSRGLYLPRRKAALAALAALDPIAAELVHAFSTGPAEHRLGAVEALARRALGVDTFFEWASAPDPVAP